jgi:hypothetical protein
MSEPFEKNLRIVRLRCSINLLTKYAGWILAGAGIIAVLAVLIERLLALDVIFFQTVLGLASFVITMTMLIWLLKIPTRMQTSLLLDDRLQLAERFSTTLALARSEDSFAISARTEAYEKAQYLSLQGHFPIRFGKSWFLTASTWLVVLGLVLYMPQKDLLGFLRNRNQQQQLNQQTQQAKADVNEATKSVISAVKQLDNPELADALNSLGQPSPEAKAADIRREGIRKLGDISDQIKKMQNSVQIESLKMMQQMFKQLRGSPSAFTQQMQLALAQGNFAQASAILSQLQQDLAKGNLTDQQKKDLAEQLQNLAKRLSELAQKNDQFEKELEKLGLDKKLAQLDDKQLRHSLQKQGLSSEQIEELMQKAAASRMARSQCAGLAGAMASAGGGAGGLGADELAQALEQLDTLESIQQQIMLTEASLAEIARAIACLGEGMGDGIGFQGPFAEGDTRGSGPGTGGPGIGWGPRSTDDTGQTGTKSTRVQNKSGEGPMIASWYFKESQIKGQARRQYSEVIQAGRDSAAEAITENEIPRRYEDAIKKYFSQIEQAEPNLPASNNPGVSTDNPGQ